jgi:predicted dehydrogenase
MKKLRLLIVGTGSMAANHAAAFAADPRCEVVGGVDVSQERAAEFCAAQGIAHAFGDLDAAIAWGGFDAAANVTPDAVHHPTTMKLLAAGKHVFCEKPLADSYPLADEMARAADAAGLVNMVNLSYRNVAALEKARGLIAAGEIGRVRHIEASYRQSWLVGNQWGDWRTDPRWLWRLSEAHGSRGVLGDVGIHILDFAAFAIGEPIVSVQSRLMTFDKAEGGQIGEYRLDANDSAILSVGFESGAVGVIHASRFMTGYANTLRLHVFGDQGALELEHGMASTQLRLCNGADVHNQAWHEVVCPPVASNYTRFVDAVMEGGPMVPDFRHAADLQQIIDACYSPQAIGARAVRLPESIDPVIPTGPLPETGGDVAALV